MPEQVTQPGELKDRVVHINRVTKVVKGGKNFSFAALVVKLRDAAHLPLPVTGAGRPGDPPADRRFLSVAPGRPFALEDQRGATGGCRKRRARGSG